MRSVLTNEFGQEIGAPLPEWTPPGPPAHAVTDGRYCRLVPLTSALASDLYAAFSEELDGREWTYLPYGPFPTEDAFRRWIDVSAHNIDPQFYAIVDAATGRASGVASYLRITPTAGAIEVGSLHFSPSLRRTRAATEAMYLMMKRAFELRYRRYEWKCDALNAPSRLAALRFGFSFEGIFRQAVVYKGRNRDTAWYSVIDSEWPRLARAFEAWLRPDNFDDAGHQRVRLGEFMAASGD